MQDNLDDIVTQSAASLMNINVKKLKKYDLEAVRGNNHTRRIRSYIKS